MDKCNKPKGIVKYAIWCYQLPNLAAHNYSSTFIKTKLCPGNTVGSWVFAFVLGEETVKEKYFTD